MSIYSIQFWLKYNCKKIIQVLVPDNKYYCEILECCMINAKNGDVIEPHKKYKAIRFKPTKKCMDLIENEFTGVEFIRDNISSTKLANIILPTASEEPFESMPDIIKKGYWIMENSGFRLGNTYYYSVFDDYLFNKYYKIIDRIDQSK